MSDFLKEHLQLALLEYYDASSLNEKFTPDEEYLQRVSAAKEELSSMRATTQEEIAARAADYSNQQAVISNSLLPTNEEKALAQKATPALRYLRLLNHPAPLRDFLSYAECNLEGIIDKARQTDRIEGFTPLDVSDKNAVGAWWADCIKRAEESVLRAEKILEIERRRVAILQDEFDKAKEFINAL